MHTRPISALALVACATASLIAARQVHAQLGRQQGLLEPNVATEAQMLALPHMDSATVKAIVGARPVLSITALDAMLPRALTKAQRDTLYSKMFIHVDLNRGTDAEFLLIPRVDAKMLGQLKAPRPWTSFAQFATEIGKTANATEVARLEQYLFIPMDINTASDSLMMTFASIGVGTARWIREYKEYRPWTSMEQFRRELGKYLRSNPKELTRLERYVIIK
jgi:hypothetical protein